MPHFLYSILIPFYFTFFRVFPILTITKQIYFILTQGKNRVLSKSEVLGRLSFCGYETISEKVINDTCYFIAKKKRTVSQERYPSYGPIVKLKRIGYNGERIYIYKVRTMYPYSEFIQGDIYEKHHINRSGKFQNDFRITTWGKFFRAYFIDEIPQLYNWLIGDIKLVGVRALSEQYFNLYPKDIQELRVKSKPGLIPPYYADMPNSFEEIVNSEKKYLLEKEKKPIKTDLKYLTKAFYNIIFHGARSK
jgi:lipopolysaccharide/colanic/teichoic acid biosynthesis glycosyltransferase